MKIIRHWSNAVMYFTNYLQSLWYGNVTTMWNLVVSAVIYNIVLAGLQLLFSFAKCKRQLHFAKLISRSLTKVFNAGTAKVQIVKSEQSICLENELGERKTVNPSFRKLRAEKPIRRRKSEREELDWSAFRGKTNRTATKSLGGKQ